jgi:hypothetical protein
LRGDGLADAKAWVARRKDNAPEITALLTSFLTASSGLIAFSTRIGARRLRRIFPLYPEALS